MDIDTLTGSIIGAAIEVHRELGPGLLESSYQACLSWELIQRGLDFERQKRLPLTYKGTDIEFGYRLDLLVEDLVVVEIKAVESLTPVHAAQILTYLRLTTCPVGLLINFNVRYLRDGLRRFVLSPCSP